MTANTLPKIEIIFQKLAAAAIAAGNIGIVAVILYDDTNSEDSFIYNDLPAVNRSSWTALNYRLLKLLFEGGPSKVLVERQAVSTIANITAAVARLATKSFDYLIVPNATTDEALGKSWIIAQRALGKTFKYISKFSSAPDNEAIIDFQTTGIISGDEAFFTDASHGQSDNDRITFLAKTTMPGALDSAVSYFVIEEDTDDFKISETLGGTGVEITSIGEDVVYFIGGDEQSCVVSDSSGDLLVTDVAHGRANGDVVKVDAASMPTGVERYKLYYIVEKTLDTFKLSLTSGGAALAYSAAGTTVTYNLGIETAVQRGDSYGPEQYTARIAGVLAGLPLTRSATYYKLADVKSFTQSADVEADIAAGKLVLYDDGAGIKIATAVNSLTTLTSSKPLVFTKIQLMMINDYVSRSISDTFRTSYVGNYPNSYNPGKIQWMAAVNVFLKSLMDPYNPVLDPDAENKVDIDVDAQKAWLLLDGWTEAQLAELSESTIKKLNTDDKGFYIVEEYKPVLAMQDMQLKLNM